MHQMAVLAVDRHEPLGLHQVEQELQLLLRRVPRDVHRRVASVNHLGTRTVQRIDHARHVRLVARDRVRGDDDDVVGADLHVLVLVRRHERQRAHRLTLRAGAHDAHLARRVARHLVDVDHPIARNIQHAHLATQRDVLHHRPAEERDPATRADRGIADLAHAMEVRRERRDDDAAIGMVAKHGAHRRADRGFRRREPGPFCVGGIGKQQLDATARLAISPITRGRSCARRRA